MLYLTVLALVGLVCASGFRWPIMLICSVLVGAATLAFALAQGGAHAGEALLRAAGAALTLQFAYVLGGFALSLRSRRLGSKRDIRA